MIGEARPTFSPSFDQLAEITEDLVYFVHRVARDEKSTPAEVAALPEIAKVLYRLYKI